MPTFHLASSCSDSSRETKSFVRSTCVSGMCRNQRTPNSASAFPHKPTPKRRPSQKNNPRVGHLLPARRLRLSPWLHKLPDVFCHLGVSVLGDPPGPTPPKQKKVFPSGVLLEPKRVVSKKKTHPCGKGQCVDLKTASPKTDLFAQNLATSGKKLDDPK